MQNNHPYIIAIQLQEAGTRYYIDINKQIVEVSKTKPVTILTIQLNFHFSKKQADILTNKFEKTRSDNLGSNMIQDVFIFVILCVCFLLITRCDIFNNYVFQVPAEFDFLRAMDFFFKCHFVFHQQFNPQLKHMMAFIQHFIFKIPFQGKLLSKLHEFNQKVNP